MPHCSAIYDAVSLLRERNKNSIFSRISNFIRPTDLSLFSRLRGGKTEIHLLSLSCRRTLFSFPERKTCHPFIVIYAARSCQERRGKFSEIFFGLSWKNRWHYARNLILYSSNRLKRRFQLQTCGHGGIGRRIRLRILWGISRAGSSPVVRTKCDGL